MDKELIEKAKQAKTPEELYEMAKEVGRAMTEESAKEYFDMLHPKTGELGDDERDRRGGRRLRQPQGRPYGGYVKGQLLIFFSMLYFDGLRGTDMSKISSGTLFYLLLKMLYRGYCPNCKYMV